MFYTCAYILIIMVYQLLISSSFNPKQLQN